MGKQDISIGQERQVMQGAIGAQSLMVIAGVPAGASLELIGEVLLGKTLTATGVYRVLVPIAGLASGLQCHLTATWSGGTVSSDLDSLFFVSDISNGATWTKKTAGTGDGAVTSTTRQTSTLSTIAGERYAVYDLTLTGTTSVVINQAEYNGI